MNYSHGDSAEALLSETHSRVVERRGPSKVDSRVPAKQDLAGVRCTWQLRWQHVDGVHGCICLCMCVQVHMHVHVQSMVVVIYVLLDCSPFYLLGEGPLVKSRACLLSSVASQLASGMLCLPNTGITGGHLGFDADLRDPNLSSQVFVENALSAEPSLPCHQGSKASLLLSLFLQKL